MFSKLNFFEMQPLHSKPSMWILNSYSFLGSVYDEFDVLVIATSRSSANDNTI